MDINKMTALKIALALSEQTFGSLPDNFSIDITEETLMGKKPAWVIIFNYERNPKNPVDFTHDIMMPATRVVYVPKKLEWTTVCESD